MLDGATRDTVFGVNLATVFVFCCCVTSFGVLLVTVGGSWDITNHLLNKPETFFSPPHALMYLGVAVALAGVALCFFAWHKTGSSDYKFSVRMMVVGVFLLVGAGPFDYLWHLNFGLDGLLSPSHMTLILGMIFTSFGSFSAIAKYGLESKNRFFVFVTPLAVLPVWLSSSGMISSLSLPFSDTEFFKFNPEPHLAVIVATISFPFLISFWLFTVARVAEFRFGVLSVTGVLFVMVSAFTGIVTNQAILDTLGFYFLNVIPIIAGDVVLSKYRGIKFSTLSVGALLGSVFVLMYYPYVVYTYNEVMGGMLISPSMIGFVYFDILGAVFAYVLLPGVAMGIMGTLFSEKLVKRLEHVGSKEI